MTTFNVYLEESDYKIESLVIYLFKTLGKFTQKMMFFEIDGTIVSYSFVLLQKDLVQ